MKKINAEKKEFVEGLVRMYNVEVEATYAVWAAWKLLKDDAKNKCADDFDNALIARETILEEVAEMKNDGITTTALESSVSKIDQKLIELTPQVREIYGLDVKSLLNIRQPKKTIKSK